jgi:hypothetical protein
VDVETGKRVNIFFGENSIYRDTLFESFNVRKAAGDMLWNPSAVLAVDLTGSKGRH